jgi:radical SAM protein with 4Fe4S-binding SPASM domain
MMEYATRLRKAVSIVTNGTLIDRDAAVRIVRDRVFHINISLKAVSADKFASVTGSSGELFSKIIYGIRLLNEEKRKSKSGLKVELSYVLSRSRLSDMVEVIKLADALNVGYLLFNNYIPFGAFDKEGEKEVLFSDDKEINDAIAESAKLAKKVKVSWPPLMHRGSYSRYCPSAFKSLNIDAEGNITCCGRVLPPSSEYGNIFQDKSAWNSDYVARLRDNFLSPDKEIPDRCKLCVEMA